MYSRSPACDVVPQLQSIIIAWHHDEQRLFQIRRVYHGSFETSQKCPRLGALQSHVILSILIPNCPNSVRVHPELAQNPDHAAFEFLGIVSASSLGCIHGHHSFWASSWSRRPGESPLAFVVRNESICRVLSKLESRHLKDSRWVQSKSQPWGSSPMPSSQRTFRKRSTPTVL